MKFLLVTVLRQNQVTFNPTINKEIACDNMDVIGVVYMVPDVVGGQLPVYNPRVIVNPAEAPTDAPRALKLQDKESLDYYYIALGSSQTEADFATACNACCGGSNAFTQNFTWPTPNSEEDLCLVNGNYTAFGVTPANPFAGNVMLEGFTYNGGQPLPFTQTAGGYASNAALVTALTTNASALGTWTLTGGKIQLVSTTVKSAYINPVVLAKSYCFAPPANPGFTGAFLTTNDASNAPIAQPFPAIAVSQANVEAVATALRNRMPNATITVAAYSGTSKITVVTTQKPINIKNADASTTVTFSAGVCS